MNIKTFGDLMRYSLGKRKTAWYTSLWLLLCSKQYKKRRQRILYREALRRGNRRIKAQAYAHSRFMEAIGNSQSLFQGGILVVPINLGASSPRDSDSE